MPDDFRIMPPPCTRHTTWQGQTSRIKLVHYGIQDVLVGTACPGCVETIDKGLGDMYGWLVLMVYAGMGAWYNSLAMPQNIFSASFLSSAESYKLYHLPIWALSVVACWLRLVEDKNSRLTVESEHASGFAFLVPGQLQKDKMRLAEAICTCCFWFLLVLSR